MSEHKRTTLNTIFKHGSKEDIKKAIMEETAINKNAGLASKGLFLLTVVVDSLVHLREKNKFDLNIDSYNDHLSLEKVIALTHHNTLPLEDVFKVKNYLDHIPSFDKAKSFFDQRDVVRDHHERVRESVKLVLS